MEKMNKYPGHKSQCIQEEQRPMIKKQGGDARTCSRRRLSNDAKRAFLQCYVQPSQPSVALAARAANYFLAKKGVVPYAAATYRRFLKGYREQCGRLIDRVRKGEARLKPWDQRGKAGGN